MISKPKVNVTCDAVDCIRSTKIELTLDVGLTVEQAILEELELCGWAWVRNDDGTISTYCSHDCRFMSDIRKEHGI